MLPFGELGSLAERYHIMHVFQECLDGVSVSLCEDQLTGDLFVVKTARKATPGRPDQRTQPLGHDPDSGLFLHVMQDSMDITHDPESDLFLQVSEDSIGQEIHVAEQILNQPTQTHTVRFIRTIDTLTHHGVVMEFYPRGDLFSLLEQQPSRRFVEPSALAFFRQIVESIEYLQTLGIAHRDISLENLLLDNTQRARIGDFGLSTNTSTPAQGSVGKLLYMAPEVAISSRTQASSTSGSEYDPVVADVWSLGIALFIMLTGSPLFTLAVPADPAWTVVKHLGVAGILSSWGFADEISEGTISLLSDMLRIDPKKRLESPGAILSRLDGHV